MRVLVVGTLPDAVVRVEDELQAAGHDVVRCHEDPAVAFPCAALVQGQRCPLEAAPVDVAVTVRGGTDDPPSVFEDGAICAVRRHVPLVTVGVGENPFEPWTAVEVESGDDLAAACEEAATAPLPEHTRVATAEMRDVIERAGLDPADARVEVRRRGGALKVALHLPEDAATLHGTIAARVITALRAIDTESSGIDIGVDVATPG
jgi:hypothetical protein